MAVPRSKLAAHVPTLHEPALHDGDELPTDGWSLEMLHSSDEQTEYATRVGAATATRRQSPDATSSQFACAIPPLHEAGSRRSSIPLPSPFGFPPYVPRQRSPPPPPQQSSPEQQSPTQHSYESECDRGEAQFYLLTTPINVPATIPDAGPHVRRRAHYSREARRQHRIIRQRFVRHPA